MKPKDMLMLLLLAALWGGSFLFMRMAAPVLGPVWLIEARILLAGLALLPLLFRRNPWPQVKEKISALVVVGCIGSAFPFLLLAFASLTLPAGVTSIINATTPLFGIAIATLFYSETFTLNRLLGIVLGFVGVVVLIGWQRFVFSPMLVAAIVAGLGASTMYAIVAPYAKKHLSELSSLTNTTISLLCGAIALMPLLPFTAPTTLPSPAIVLAVLALALLSTSLAYLLYFNLLQSIGPTKVLTVTYLIPAFAMVWGFFILDEPITAPMVLGCGLILVGTAFANDLLKPRRKAKF